MAATCRPRNRRDKPDKGAIEHGRDLHTTRPLLRRARLARCRRPVVRYFPASPSLVVQGMALAAGSLANVRQRSATYWRVTRLAFECAYCLACLKIRFAPRACTVSWPAESSLFGKGGCEPPQPSFKS